LFGRLGWAACAIAWAGAATTDIWWDYYAVVCAVVAAAIWLAGREWKLMALAWSFLAFAIWVGAGYLEDTDGMFYFGLLGAVASLVFFMTRFRAPAFVVHATSTLLLVLIGLLVADFFTGADKKINMNPATWRRYYSFHGAGGNPGAMAKWWQFFNEDQFSLVENDIFDIIPGGSPGHRLRPNSHTTLFRSSFSIDSKGFRGPEIPPQKGNAYRIVALGESTTFGMTLLPNQKPWPELLEQMIRERLKPGRPVEVINAGVPGYALSDNLSRLRRDILPLKPDMIISYHGYNGFPQINAAIPPPDGPPPPRYKSRPLALLARCEYRVKMNVFRSRYVNKFRGFPSRVVSPLKTAYALQYRELIATAVTNGVRLVLANFSMAVNSNSNPRVIEFYRSAFPPINRLIQANEEHSLLVHELAAENPQVTLVDTHPRLDGENEKFIDVVHLTQKGRQQLAENIFAGIRDVLKKDLNLSDEAKVKPRRQIRAQTSR
jgi:lysophospholipase L1-like esterase